ncbi:hypothetical protein MCUN1_000981 [Malassezia cuniculi]|uniref:Protein RER1 n=1 Tax=Malassezia cuniculi TaxID=948313 RepID=A0AAF0ES16_9BASI|nr:hypothetical protein MCUN1_000981 [Malassezia cuniculi]
MQQQPLDHNDGPSNDLPLQRAVHQAIYFHRRAQTLIDSTAPFTLQRWGATAVLLCLFMLRVVLAQGWYIVCYALFIYLLNLFLAFLSPKFDPEFDDLAAQDVEDGAPGLPTSAGPAPSRSGLMSGVFAPPPVPDEEFRPFIRRLPEFKFWLSASQAIVLSIFATFFSAFDVPVYWPILLVYFIILFVITMRRQIQHMIHYKYIPFDFGRKARYGRS